jgi:signal transduction histidine kinase
MSGERIVSVLLAAAWLLVAVATWRLRRAGLLGCAVALVAGQVAAAADAALAPVALAGWLGYALAVPGGRWGDRTRTAIGLIGGAALLGWAARLVSAGGAPSWSVLVPVVLGILGVGMVSAGLRCRRASLADRRTLQWLAAAVVVAGACQTAVLALHVLIGAPASLHEALLGALLLVPAAQALALHGAAGEQAEKALVEAVAVAGTVLLAVAVYLVVVVGLGRPPVGAERDVLLSSIVAAVIVAVLAMPVRHRLVGYGRALVGRDADAPGDPVSSFGARMSRAVPMDELLLQLAETLRDRMAPRGAEIWTGTDGTLVRTVSVPTLPVARLVLDEQLRVVVARARAGGARWTSVWVPQLQADGDGDLRVVPVAHLGQLLGLVVVRRGPHDDPFDEEDERVLVEIARQLGLALHNVRLDSALQQSLAELERRNVELQASRLRIVTASDQARRSIERNLHDGAQQQLVALAVKLGIAAQIAQEAPGELPELLEELRKETRETIGELRELAHGIYPPLLRDRGLGEALRAAASRCPLPCLVEVDLDRRFPEEVETATYFCCLEALQNAGKHAGPQAEVVVRVLADTGSLRFEIVDDGHGFDPDAVPGHGFVNMQDRLGAIGGAVLVESQPGAGTAVRGTIPIAAG